MWAQERKGRKRERGSLSLALSLILSSKYFQAPGLQARSQDFLGGKCDPTRRRTERVPEGGIRLCETAFRAFWKAGYFSIFHSSEVFFFFSKESTLLYNFLEWQCGMALFKNKKKKRENCKSVLLARSQHHDVSIVCQAQASLGVS